MKSRNLVGETFGRLTVLYREMAFGHTKDTYWRCSCSCGNSALVKTNHLLSGNTKSCGCLAKERAKQWAKENAIDMVGQTVKTWEVVCKATQYERSSVLKLSKSVNQIYWKCRCTYCGSYSYFGGKELRDGIVGSCSCAGGRVLWANKISHILGMDVGYAQVESLLNPEDIVVHGMATIGLSKSRWLCRCVCGLGFEIDYKTLRCYERLKTPLSCGCSDHKLFEPGKQFGKWLILAENKLGDGRKSTWISQCVCGYKRTMTEQTLRIARKEVVVPHTIETHVNNPNRTHKELAGLYNTELVYFIRENSGAVKIGCTNQIKHRLAGLQHTSPYPLTILALANGYKDLEKEIHKKLNSSRLKGEWFIYNEDLLKVIADLEWSGRLLWKPSKEND